jgi:pimeloyl-ACP methyl ester carboxylesterase
MKYGVRCFTTILCGLLLLIFTNSKAQDAWVSYSHKIEVKGYEGLRFRLQGLARTEVKDDSASARLWVRVDKENGIGFFDNMEKRPIRSSEWKKYSIEGRIDSAGTQLSFGALCSYNGKFYYDDIKLDIEIKKGKWKNIFSADFENGDIPLRQGRVDSNFKAQVIRGPKAQGAQYLMIEGTNVPTYGVNSKAGRYAHVNGIKLYYEVYGQGTPLVILHGNGGSIENASTFYPDLIKNYKVIAVDSRAHGKSGDTEAPLSYDLMASDVNELLDQMKLDSVFIWGQSDGAILGLILAMDYPKKVKKVIAFGSNIRPDSSAIFSWAIAGMQKILKESTDPRERKLNRLMVEYPNIPYSKLSTIKSPILIVAGDRDAIRPEHTLKLFQHIPNSQLCIIPGATHGAAWEKKGLFLMILDDFFNKPFTMPDTKSWY